MGFRYLHPCLPQCTVFYLLPKVVNQNKNQLTNDSTPSLTFGENSNSHSKE